MDPIEVREQRVTSNVPPAPVDTTRPVAGSGVYERNVGATPPAGSSVYRSRTASAPAVNRLAQLVWLVIGVVDAILALHFIFRAVGANNTGFAHYIYRLGGSLAAPFEGIFTNTVAKGAAIHWADLLAIAVYTFAAWAVAKLLRILTRSR